jgi:hypothetical protein
VSVLAKVAKAVLFQQVEAAPISGLLFVVDKLIGPK